MGSKSLTILQLFFNPKFYYQNFLLWPNAIKKSWSAHVELCVIQFSDCYVEPGQRYSMISETLPNWGGLKVENFGGKFKFQNLSSWNTLFSTLGGDEITFSGFIWGQELITKCPCWVKLHITEDNFCHFFKPPQFRFFLSKNVKLFEAIRTPLVLLWIPHIICNFAGVIPEQQGCVCAAGMVHFWHRKIYALEALGYRVLALQRRESKGY